MIPYNYNVLKDDINEKPLALSYNELMRIDCIDIYKLENKNKMLNDCFYKYVDRYMNDDPDSKKYMFKEISVYYNEKNNIAVYNISDSNRRELNRGFDQRTITITNYRLTEDRAILTLTFKCKLEHLYKIYSDIDIRLQYSNTFKSCFYEPNVPKFNLYVLPIYVSRNGDDYIRISDTKNLEVGDIMYMITTLFLNIRDFLGLNTLIFDALESNKIYDEDTYTEHIKKIKVEGTSDKYSKKDIIKKSSKIKRKRQVKYIEYNGEYIPIILRKEQVRGHHKYVWHGSKKDNTRHKERIWVEPYIRNINKSSRLVKNYS